MGLNYHVLSKYRTELMGAAIFWVMLFHSFDLNLGFGFLNRLRDVGFGGVDIFILLSAVGLVSSLSKREQRCADFMARRAGRVLPAYYLVMVPYTVFLILCRGVPWSTLAWNASLLYYWVQPAGAFNWYVAGIMAFYLVTPFCFRCLQRSKHRNLLGAAGVLAGMAVSGGLLRADIWYALDVTCRIPIFFLGLTVSFYVVEERKLGLRDLLFWSGWLGLALVYRAVRTVPELRPFFPLDRMFLFVPVPLCLAACWCFEHLPLGWLRRVLRLLGTYSLEIYLLNVSLFSEVGLLRGLVSFGPSNRLYYLVSYTANVALAVLVHKVVDGLRKLWKQCRDRKTV